MSTWMSCKTVDEPAGQPLNLSIIEITVSRGHVPVNAFHPYRKTNYFSFRFARLCIQKSTFSLGYLSSLSLSLFLSVSPILTRHSVSLSIIRNTRALRNRATPAAGQAWMSDSRGPAACVRGRVRTLPGHVCDSRARAPIFRPSPRLRRLAYALFTPSG